MSVSNLQVTLKVDSGVALAGEGALGIAVSVWFPETPHLHESAVALVCLPGGNMNRRYFDLRPADGDETFSFALQMTARGFVVVALDYLGLGDSSKPRDGYALAPDVLTQACVNATDAILARLRAGLVSPDAPALPQLTSIGVGHSMGAMMTVLLQAQSRAHAAIALLGFSTRGLPEYVPADVRVLDQAAQRARLVEDARRMFREPYPVIRSSGNGAETYGSAKAEARGIAALKAATDCLLPVTAFMSMLPGNVAPEAAQIDVPVFLGLGERDMAGPPHLIPAAFPASRDVTLHILPETGHSHFLFPSRAELFDRMAAWGREVLG